LGALIDSDYVGIGDRIFQAIQNLTDQGFGLGKSRKDDPEYQNNRKYFF
jgi:hypothetical protein